MKEKQKRLARLTRQRKPKKHRLHPLEGFLVLSIAPLLDFKSIQALRLTSKTIKETLDLYERSTVAENLSYKTFPIQPQDTLLCSSYPDRPRISIETYAAIKELEDRTRKIDWLVQCSRYLRRGYLRCGIERISLPERKRTTAALKRALWICTDLADLEAREWTRRSIVKSRAQKLECQHEPPQHSVDDLSDGVNLDDVPETTSTMLATVHAHGYFMPHVHPDGTFHQFPGRRITPAPSAQGYIPPARAIRQAQLDYLNNLSTRDLAAIFVIMNLATRGFEDYLGNNRLASYPNDIITEWTVAVSENAVRHGVFFLYPQALRGNPSKEKSRFMTDTSVCLGPVPPGLPPTTPRGPKNMTATGSQIRHHRCRSATTGANAGKQRMDSWSENLPCCRSCSHHMAATAAAMVCQVVEEMQVWESGQDQDMLPGLGMTLRGTLRERLGCDNLELTPNCAMIVRGRKPTYGTAKDTWA